MITRDIAIRNTHSNVFIVNNEIEAFDKNGNKIELNESLISAEIAKLEEANLQELQNKDMVKQSALVKLAALGLTQDEVKALVE